MGKTKGVDENVFPVDWVMEENQKYWSSKQFKGEQWKDSKIPVLALK